MASDVYTISMFTAKELAGIGSSIGPPAGYRWVVTNIDTYRGNQTSAVTIYLADVTNNVIWWADTSTEEIQTWVQWTGRHVIDYPSKWYVDVNGGNADICASGFQLTLP